MNVMIAAFALFLLTSIVTSRITCQLSEEVELCDSTSEEDVPRKVIVGPPGKQGPKGPPGDLRNCNCTDYEEIQKKVMDLEETVRTLKSNVEFN